MTMRSLLIPLALTLLLSAAPARALITYKDENGTLHAVKSEDEIPEQYRKKTKRLKDNKAESGAVGILPVTKFKDAWLAEVEVGEAGTFKFLIDPRQYVTVVSPDIAADLKKQRIDNSIIDTPTGVARVPMIIVSYVKVAGRALSQIKVAVAQVDLESGAQGRIGLSFLERFDYKIDEAKGLLILGPKGAPPKAVLKEEKKEEKK